jgi:hypothetical protein
MLEDDDYSLRVRTAGYRLVCAEDVFVHHFGEASFGALVPSGEYSRLIAENRKRFEEKWGRPWRPYDRRTNGAYETLKDRIRGAVAASVPAEATVLVLSRGDDDLLDLEGRRGVHFPQTDEGVYAGHHPGSSQEAIAHLEDLSKAGAQYLLIPKTGFWWLDFYKGLRSYLIEDHRQLYRDETCIIFSIGRGHI